jgi:heptaprenyl diphosphate synthase
MAFQIIDDILDFNSNELIIGKPVGNDLKEGIYTLPLIYALQRDNKDLSDILISESYSDNDIKRIIGLVNNLGGIEMSRELAKKYTEKAFKQLSILPESDSKKILMEITEKLLIRDY